MAILESLQVLFTNVGFFGVGLLLPILALIIGSARGISTNKATLSTVIASLAWLVALIIPNAIFAGSLFMIGAIAITTVYAPMLKESNTSNIIIVAVIALALNITIMLGSGVYEARLNWGNNFDDIQTGIYSAMENVGLDTDKYVPSNINGLCEVDEDGELNIGDCQNNLQQGDYNALNFDPIASIIAVGDFVGRIFKVIIFSIFAPYLISSKLIMFSKGNAFVQVLLGLYGTFWNLAIFYNLAKFITNKRGMD